MDLVDAGHFGQFVQRRGCILPTFSIAVCDSPVTQTSLSQQCARFRSATQDIDRANKPVGIVIPVDPTE